MDAVLGILFFFGLSNLVTTFMAMSEKENKKDFIIRLLMTNMICSIFIGSFII